MMNESLLGDETVRSDFDRSETPSSIAVVEVIAAIKNVPPTDLMWKLHDHIDPEALDALVDDDSDVSVSFSVDQYQV